MSLSLLLSLLSFVHSTVPLSIIIAPMLLEKAPSNDDNQSTSHENSESYVQLYVMVINVIKSALLLIASLGPRTTSTLVASTITTSFVMGLITLSWFHFARPQKYVDIQPASIPFINVFKVSSYFSSVVTAMVVIISHQIGEDGFSSNDMAIVLAFAWIAVIALSYYYFNRWKASKSEFLTEEESLIEFPFKHRDCEKKEIIDISYPGDIIGVHDTGNFKIGDSFSEGEDLEFVGIPSFSPENFKYIINQDPMKSKQLSKGILQLMDEGVAQLFTLTINGRKIIGTVGVLQFDVIKYRLEHEYGAKCSYENINISKACWIDEKKSDKTQLEDFMRQKQKFIALDKENKKVFLSDSLFTLAHTKQKFDKLVFHEKSEF